MRIQPQGDVMLATALSVGQKKCRHVDWKLKSQENGATDNQWVVIYKCEACEETCTKICESPRCIRCNAGMRIDTSKLAREALMHETQRGVRKEVFRCINCSEFGVFAYRADKTTF